MFVSDRRWPQLGWPARPLCNRLSYSHIVTGDTTEPGTCAVLDYVRRENLACCGLQFLGAGFARCFRFIGLVWDHVHEKFNVPLQHCACRARSNAHIIL